MKADAPVRSREEIEEAIRGFSEAQWARLRKVSENYAWVYRIDSDDLIQQAFERALGGGRQCPAHVDVLKFLADAIRSIANGEAEKPDNRAVKVPIAPGALLPEVEKLKAMAVDQETALIAAEDEEALRDAAHALFPNDPLACDIIDGILAGYQGKELQQLTDINETSYASKRRLMRRTIDKHHQAGEKR